MGITLQGGPYAGLASALGGVSAESQGASASATDAQNATAIQAAVTAAIAAGSKLVTFARSYHFNATIQIGASGVRFVAASPDQAVSLGWTGGAGTAIQIGTDNGQAYDANLYDGFYGFTMEHITLFVVSPTTALTNGQANYTPSSYGIRDWRGGSVTLDHVRITGFDYPFWGIQSDVNTWNDSTFQSNHSGVYLGPRSDQFVGNSLYFLANDRALDVDSASQPALNNPRFVNNGAVGTNPIRIRSAYTRGAVDVTFNNPWFEHLIGPAVLESFIEVGIGDTTTANGVHIKNPTVVTGTAAEAVHMQYLVKIDRADHIDLDVIAPGFIVSLDNIFKFVTNSGAAPQVTCRLPHDLTLAAAAKYVKTGSVTPSFVLVDWGSQGWGLSDGAGRESMRLRPSTGPIFEIVDPLTGFIAHRMTWTTQDAGQLFIDLNQATSQIHIRDAIGSGNDLFRVQPSTGAYIPGGVDPNDLTTGESSIRRRDIDTNGISQGSGTLRLAYFTARKTETITQVRFVSGGTAAAATPSLCRIGIWTANAAGALLALVASTPNDTTLWAAGSTTYTKSLSSSFAKVVGQRYAVGVLVVTATTAPTMVGTNGVGGLPATETGQSPRISGAVSGQSDLPSSVVAGSVADNASAVYVVILP